MAGLVFRGGASTRFQPNRRASTEKSPGPSSASAPPMVPSRSEAHVSPVRVSVCHASSKASNPPASGVHRPGMRRSPHATESMELIPAAVGGSLHNIRVVWTTTTEPPIRRMPSKPMPGNPPANVEYRRRKSNPSKHLSLSQLAGASKPQKGPSSSLSRGSSHRSALSSHPAETTAR